MAAGKQFATPKRRLVVEKNSFSDPKQRHERYIKEHFFNFSAEILVPNLHRSDLVARLQDVSPMSDVYCIVECPISMFIEEDFIQTFVKKGHLFVLSQETRIDSSNVAAILPNGKMILSLDKDTYEELGLQGKSSSFNKGCRFVVEIDLAAASFVPGKKLYERVKWCFKDRLNLTYKFLISWTKSGAPNSCDEILSYFTDCPKHKVSLREEFTLHQSQAVPLIDWTESGFTAEDNKNEHVTDAMACFDWLGCIACGIDCSEGKSDNYVSTLNCPEPSHQTAFMSSCKWTGFITPNRIQHLLQTARNLLKENCKIPWVALTVWGFIDGPVTWGNREHGYTQNGDNLYTFVIFPGSKYWAYLAVGQDDFIP